MMTRIKLCGMMRRADAACARALRADYVGFILSAGFRRSLDYDTFCTLRGELDGSDSRCVGVFVNAPAEAVADYAPLLDLIQLHGQEDDAYIAQLREKTALPIIKAYRIGSAADLELAARSSADYVLLDSGTGTGKAFDWELLSDFPRRFFLAGGLTPENAAEAVRRFHPFAVDTSSGIETDGVKDAEKMRRFAEAVRRAE